MPRFFAAILLTVVLLTGSSHGWLTPGCQAQELLAHSRTRRASSR